MPYNNMKRNEYDIYSLCYCIGEVPRCYKQIRREQIVLAIHTLPTVFYSMASRPHSALLASAV